MGTVTHAQVHELVRKLPETKLALVVHFLRDLADIDVETLSHAGSPRLTEMEPGRRSLDERRHILAQQAERMKDYYVQTADERTEWQAGEFSDG